MAVDLIPTDTTKKPGRLEAPKWRHCLALAQEYGWRPKGTVPSDVTTEFYARGRVWDGDYIRSDFQVVTAADAFEMATALQRALAELPDEKAIAGQALPGSDGETFNVMLAHRVAPRDWFAGQKGKELLKVIIEFLLEGSFVIA